MRIYDLQLHNIGPFIDSKITIRDRDKEGSSVTILTGQNGTGKSVVIDAIRTLFLGIYSYNLERDIIKDKNDFFIKATIFDGYKTITLSGDSLTKGTIGGAGLNTNFPLGQHIYYEFNQKPSWILDYWSATVRKDSYKITSIAAVKPEDYLKKSLVGEKTNSDVTKLICFFDYLKGSDSPTERKLGEFLFYTCTEIINSCLLNARFSHVSRTTLEPIISTNNAQVSLDKLSSGNSFLIQRMLSLLMQAYCVYELNQTEIQDICKVPGLLLMDEAENHLHPKWQKSMLSNILKFFPNLQIVLTTHSPFLITSVENARILVTKTEGDHSIVIDATDYYENKPVEDILRTPLFETDSFNIEISQLLSERKDAIEKNDQGKVKYVENELLKINPEYFSYLDLESILSDIKKG